MAWNDLTFVSCMTLSASHMTAIDGNFDAIAAQDAGSPLVTFPNSTLTASAGLFTDVACMHEVNALGRVWAGSGFVGAQANSLGNLDVASGLSYGGLDILGLGPLLHVQNQQNCGTNGGTFTSGAWRTRDLNTVVTSQIAGTALASNQVTLPPGDYFAMAWATAIATRHTRLRIQDVTSAATYALGPNIRIAQSASDGGDGGAASPTSGKFTLTDTHEIEVQHRGSATAGTIGFGEASGFAIEVYTDLKIWKEG